MQYVPIRGGKTMATKKTTTKKTTTKPETVLLRGKEYFVVERNEHKTKLTDGTIHFWARNEDVEVHE